MWPYPVPSLIYHVPLLSTGQPASCDKQTSLVYSYGASLIVTFCDILLQCARCPELDNESLPPTKGSYISVWMSHWLCGLCISEGTCCVVLMPMDFMCIWGPARLALHAGWVLCPRLPSMSPNVYDGNNASHLCCTTLY